MNSEMFSDKKSRLFPMRSMEPDFPWTFAELFIIVQKKLPKRGSEYLNPPLRNFQMMILKFDEVRFIRNVGLFSTNISTFRPFLLMDYYRNNRQFSQLPLCIQRPSIFVQNCLWNWLKYSKIMLSYFWVENISTISFIWVCVARMNYSISVKTQMQNSWVRFHNLDPINIGICTWNI